MTSVTGRAVSVKAIGGFQANKMGAVDLNVVPRAGLELE